MIVAPQLLAGGDVPDRVALAIAHDRERVVRDDEIRRLALELDRGQRVAGGARAALELVLRDPHERVAHREDVVARLRARRLRLPRDAHRRRGGGCSHGGEDEGALHFLSSTTETAGLFARHRSSAPITGVTIASAVAPTSRNVTSTPRLDEFGFMPHLIARIRPLRRNMRATLP